MNRNLAARLFTYLLALSTASLGFLQPVMAAQLGTQTVLAMEDRATRAARVEASLAREDVRAAMVELGVAPADAQGRLAALTDDELRILDEQLQTLPAGGLLAVIGVVFIVLLILEVTGVTDVFKKI